MKPITKGQISSKLASDSSHLSALDLHRQMGREAFCFDPGNKGRIHSAGGEQLNSAYLQPCVQSSVITGNKEQIMPNSGLKKKGKKKILKRKKSFSLG